MFFCHEPKKIHAIRLLFISKTRYSMLQEYLFCKYGIPAVFYDKIIIVYEVKQCFYLWPNATRGFVYVIPAPKFG